MKIKQLILIGVIVVIAAAGFFVWQNNKKTNDTSETKLTKVTLAMDWTPNTNHTGIYVAQAKGWYKEQGIDLQLLPYSMNASSDSLVIAKKADVGIGFSEGIVADAGLGTPVVSIGSIISRNTSVIIARQDAGISSPKNLDGKIYGGYGAPYEQPVLGQVIKHDGGRGEFRNVTIDTDPITALETKKVDFVWVYEGWEGIQATQRGLDVIKFTLPKHGIPDYATPNIITSPDTIKDKSQLLQKFMTATAKGYEFAGKNPDASAKILIETAGKGTFPDEKLVYASQKYLSANYQTKGKKWGVIGKDFWIKYPQFMLDNNAVSDAAGKPVKRLDFDALFTNRFVE